MGPRAQDHQVPPGSLSFQMVIADDQYYNKPLQARRDILSAPSVNFLCKTIIFENTAYDEKFEGPFYPKYIAVMVQYVAKIHTEKLNKVIRKWQQENAEVKAAKQYFHYRLADEALSCEMTGYEHNGVVPIMMKIRYPFGNSAFRLYSAIASKNWHPSSFGWEEGTLK